MNDPQSVYEELAQHGLVGKDGMVPEVQINVQGIGGGYTWVLSPINMQDLETFAVELDNRLTGQHPAFKSLFIKSAYAFTALIRAANIHSRQGFKGARAMGNELDAVPLGADLFQDPDATSNANRVSWRRQILGPGKRQFICGQEGQGPNRYNSLMIGEDEAFGIVGYLNPAQDPCAYAVQIEEQGTRGPLERLDFGMPGPVAVSTEEVPEEPPKAAVQQPEDEQGGTLADIFQGAGAG